MIIPVGYVSYEYPKYKRHEVNKYVRKYSDIENCISYDVMKYMVKNALSRYIVQKGKCAVTHNALSISDMVCVHIKPCKGEQRHLQESNYPVKSGIRSGQSNKSGKNQKVAYRLRLDRRNERENQ